MVDGMGAGAMVGAGAGASVDAVDVRWWLLIFQ